MTASAELRVIKKFTQDKPFQKVSKVLKHLEKKRSKILNRRSEQTTLALEHELRMCEIRRYLPILNEL
jgi:hypothetical protein